MVRKSKSGYSVALQSFQVGWKVEAKETVLKVQGTGAGGGRGGGGRDLTCSMSAWRPEAPCTSGQTLP